MSKPSARWSPILRSALLLVSGVFPLGIGSGCQSMSNTEKGVGLGAGLGALTGAAVAGRHNALAGAAIGAGAGAVAGGLVGNGIDQDQKKAEARAAAATAAANARALSLQEIVQLTANGTSDSIIIGQIRSSGARYNLDGQQLLYLQQSGVREPVIMELQATAGRPVRLGYAPQPVPVVVEQPPPVVVVQPAPPPPPVGVGFGMSIRSR
jgi:hypothetical protein